MTEQVEECSLCKSMWELIRKDEDELRKLKRYPKIYRHVIPTFEQNLQRRYGLVRKCRNLNHPDTMY